MKISFGNAYIVPKYCKDSSFKTFVANKTGRCDYIDIGNEENGLLLTGEDAMVYDQIQHYDSLYDIYRRPNMMESVQSQFMSRALNLTGALDQNI